MSERPFARRVVSEKALTTRASGLRVTRRAVIRERSRQVMASATVIAAAAKNAHRMSRLKTRLLRRREGTFRDAEH